MNSTCQGIFYGYFLKKQQVVLIGILYHAYALGLLPITTKYSKIIHH